MKTNTLADKLKYFKTPAFRKNKRYSKNRNPHIGENALSIALANYLKAQTFEGKLVGTWTKIANEVSGKSLDYGILMKNMGKNAGVADFIFVNPHTHLWLELKVSAKSKMQPSQIFFKNWCIEQKCNYAVASSLKEAITILQSFAILVP